MTIDVADIALLRRNHRSDDAFLQHCYTCYQKWPCITSELLDAYEERDRLRDEIERAAQLAVEAKNTILKLRGALDLATFCSREWAGP